MSKVMRSVKNVTKGYSSSQVKVREATSNDPWGPTGTQMSEIAQLTFNSSTDFNDIMDIIDKRLNDKGKNWRHVLKALKVLDYCLHEGSELVVSWSRHNLYIIRTLREFIYIDEEGRDVGNNVRIAAKELTSLIQDDERLRTERSDRRSWKSRVTGLDEYGPGSHGDGPPPPSRRQRERRQNNDDEDTEYRLAIEASKAQEEEDRRKREGRSGAQMDDDDDLAKAIKLSKEEEERRRRELESSNNNSNNNNNIDLLFEVEQPAQTLQPVQPAAAQYTGFNQGYQQGSAVDFFANPIDQSQLQMQPTGYNPYGNFTGQPTGYQNGYGMNGFAAQPTGFDPYNQGFQMQQQQTAYSNNPYGTQIQQPQQQQDTSSLQPGSNNPWSMNNNNSAQPLQPLPTGSNNPFAANNSRPQSAQQQHPFKSSFSTLSSLPEQKTLSSFGQPQAQPFQAQQPQFQQPQKELTEHEARLNALLAGGEGMDTFGNTGQLRIPAQHTAPGTFVNSAGANLNRLTGDATGTNNPFMRQQFTGMPTPSYSNNLAASPFGVQPQQRQAGNQDLIQF